MKTTTLKFILIMMSLTSCVGNGIYFDAENKAFCACKGSSLRRISIEMEDSIVRFQLKPGGNSTHFTLSELTEKYQLVDSYPEKDSELVFKPNIEYTITNDTNGDAYRQKIKITVDSVGNVINASKTQCD